MVDMNAGHNLVQFDVKLKGFRGTPKSKNPPTTTHKMDYLNTPVDK